MKLLKVTAEFEHEGRNYAQAIEIKDLNEDTFRQAHLALGHLLQIAMETEKKLFNP